MSEDTRDFIERTQSRAVNYFGKELTPDEMATEFAKWDIDARVTALEELSRSEPDETMTREAARRMGYTRALINTHERLRRAGR